MCKYYWDQTNRVEIRQRRSKNKSKEESPMKVSNLILKGVVNAVRISEADIVKTAGTNLIESDDELPNWKR